MNAYELGFMVGMQKQGGSRLTTFLTALKAGGGRDVARHAAIGAGLGAAGSIPLGYAISEDNESKLKNILGLMWRMGLLGAGMGAGRKLGQMAGQADALTQITKGTRFGDARDLDTYKWLGRLGGLAGGAVGGIAPSVAVDRFAPHPKDPTGRE